jgi:rfaE bifunctional protein nucleotidyltransferase chain/domain
VNDHEDVEPPSLSPADAEALVAGWRAAGQRVVFTNGVFDLLHPGHVRYLQQARALGDALIVGLNSDRSVRAVKGPGRPIVPGGRAGRVLLALGCVDAVVVFDDETPHAIRRLQPDVLVKGADWALEAIVGRDVVEARGGGQVVRVSTTAPGRATRRAPSFGACAGPAACDNTRLHPGGHCDVP